MSPPDETPPRREPIFNAPWPPMALALALIGCFLLQEAAGEGAWIAYAFSPERLREGAVWTLVTTQFLHGGWAHLLMNVAGLVAFGAPVARLFGTGPRGAATFFIFYMACGVLATWGHGLAHAGSTEVAIGASGAISALMGAAGRLLERRGRLGPILGRTPVAFAIAWTAVNVAVGLAGYVPGLGFVRVAWEAHVVGFFAGMLLVGVFARIARPVFPAPH
jgi:membrane associated rhomboid family serine protease